MPKSNATTIKKKKKKKPKCEREKKNGIGTTIIKGTIIIYCRYYIDKSIYYHSEKYQNYPLSSPYSIIRYKMHKSLELP